MTDNFKCRASAEIPSIATLVSFVETTCRRLDLPGQITNKLQLAAEEVTAALAEGPASGSMMDVTLSPSADKVTLSLKLYPDGIDLKAFNVAYRPDIQKDGGWHELGLAIATRRVDLFSINTAPDGRIILSFGVFKTFDRDISEIAPLKSAGFYRLVKPTPERMLRFGELCQARPEKDILGSRFFHPDRLAALTASGELIGTLAITEEGEVIGGAFCLQTRPRMIDFYGPFVFTESEKNRIAKDLGSHTLERVARKPFSGAFSLFYDNTCFPKEFFISAGDMPGNDAAFKTAWFFPLSDDEGGDIYMSPDVSDFVTRAMNRQDLARNILQVPVAPSLKETSVLASTLSQQGGFAQLRLLVPGNDFTENLCSHVAFFKEMGMTFCHMDLDLSDPHQSSLTSKLLSQGFSPTFFVPGGAEGDLLVMSIVLGTTGGES